MLAGWVSSVNWRWEWICFLNVGFVDLVEGLVGVEVEELWSEGNLGWG